MTASHESVSAPTRRTVVAAVGAAGIAAALTACGSSDESSSSEPAGNAAKDGAAKDGAGKELAKTADIPVGGGKIFGDAGVVVTQPKKGEFKAFTNICTHKQCPVTAIEGGTINCPCHGSKFSIEDGSVKHPPAAQPLATKEITVSGDSITLA
ncbi:Rieske (2Fe-2S) protein [Streptomyces sp. NPDC001939]|uniref:Rieske (2Fe-2S) protein n=1 Tax=Streptomyces sp. NPDC056341 TaxID=3345788 RepID=UPI0035E386EF